MAALVMAESPEMPLPHESNVFPFGHDETCKDVVISDNLTEDQRRQVLQRLRECKLNARPSKCKIAMSTVDFVGHRVGGDRIQPRTALVQAIKEYPRPETKKQGRSPVMVHPSMDRPRKPLLTQDPASPT